MCPVMRRKNRASWRRREVRVRNGHDRPCARARPGAGSARGRDLSNLLAFFGPTGAVSSAPVPGRTRMARHPRRVYTYPMLRGTPTATATMESDENPLDRRRFIRKAGLVAAAAALAPASALAM